MRQGWVVTQLAVLVAWDAVDLANGRKHLRLFHRIHPEICFEIEIQVQHVSRIASLLYRQSQNALFHVTVGAAGRNCSRCWCRDSDFFLGLGCRYGRGRAGQIGTLLIHEADDMRQGWVVTQLAVLVAWNAVDLANGRKHLRLFHRIHPEVCFEVEIQVQHVSRIASLLHRQSQNALFHVTVAAAGRNLQLVLM